jgi:hypothetical protein
VADRVQSRPGTTTTVVLTRHADTDPGVGQLNATGRERARALADTVGDMRITAIYSPDLERNLDTVRPLASRLGIEITRTAGVRGSEAWALLLVGETAARCEPPDPARAETALGEALALARQSACGPSRRGACWRWGRSGRAPTEAPRRSLPVRAQPELGMIDEGTCKSAASSGRVQ